MQAFKVCASTSEHDSYSACHCTAAVSSEVDIYLAKDWDGHFVFGKNVFLYFVSYGGMMQCVHTHAHMIR